MHTILTRSTVQCAQYTITVIRCNRKGLSLRIMCDGRILARAPLRMCEEEIISFVRLKEQWIARHVTRMNLVMQGQGIEYGVAWYRGVRRSIQFTKDSEELVFLNDFFIAPECMRTQVRDLFLRWYQERAHEIIIPRVHELARLRGVSFSSCRISSARTQWASCTFSGRLRFSWHLIMAPDHVIDYVICHELAHRRHLNHSRAFWSTVALFCPDYSERRVWLKEHGFLLHM